MNCLEWGEEKVWGRQLVFQLTSWNRQCINIFSVCVAKAKKTKTFLHSLVSINTMFFVLFCFSSIGDIFR